MPTKTPESYYFHGQGLVWVARIAKDGTPMGFRPLGNVSSLVLESKPVRSPRREFSRGASIQTADRTTELTGTFSANMEGFQRENIAMLVGEESYDVVASKNETTTAKGYAGAFSYLPHMGITTNAVTSGVTSLVKYTAAGVAWDYMIDGGAGLLYINDGTSEDVSGLKTVAAATTGWQKLGPFLRINMTPTARMVVGGQGLLLNPGTLNGGSNTKPILFRIRFIGSNYIVTDIEIVGALPAYPAGVKVLDDGFPLSITYAMEQQAVVGALPTPATRYAFMFQILNKVDATLHTIHIHSAFLKNGLVQDLINDDVASVPLSGVMLCNPNLLSPDLADPTTPTLFTIRNEKQGKRGVGGEYTDIDGTPLYYQVPEVTAAPANTVAPVISGANTFGTTLTATQGTWTGGGLSYVYEWRSNGATIVGETGLTLLLTEADAEKVITFRVTATNSEGSAQATSSNSVTVQTAPEIYTGLLFGGAADRSTTIVDLLGSRTWTVNGDAKLDLNAGFWGQMLSLDGTDDMIVAGGSNDFLIWGGAATLEMLVRINANTAQDNQTLRTATLAAMYPGSGSANGGWSFGITGDSSNTGTGIRLLLVTQGGQFPEARANFSFEKDRVYHVAVTRSAAGVIDFFVDGVKLTKASDTIGTTAHVGTASHSFKIGGLGYSGFNQYLNGQISEFRMTKGVARYSANFTPQTEPHPEGTLNDPHWASVTCMMHMTGFNGAFSNAFRDTALGRNLSANGNAQISTVYHPWAYSLHFDGSGDFLTIPAGNNMNFDTGDFTIEAWVYPIALSQTYHIMFDSRNNSYANGALLWLNASGNLRAHVQGAVADAVATGVTVNRWHHVALTRQGNTIRVFVDGVLGGTTQSTTGSASNDRMYIGQTQEGGNNFAGYMDNIRITKGVARYTANFTPPAAPFAQAGDANWSSVTLLLKPRGYYGRRSITDESGTPKTVQFSGDAKLHSIAKFNRDGAIAFDGNGDFISLPHAAAIDLTQSNWTLEFWFRSNTSSGAGDIVSKRNGGSANGMTIYRNGATVQLYLSGNNTSWNLFNATTIGTLTVGRWHHVAVVRDGQTIRAYFDGVRNINSTFAGNIAANVLPLTLGSSATGGTESFNGFLDNFRFFNGRSKYSTTPIVPHQIPFTLY